MIHKLFPLIDHLYIFQLLEYNNRDFIKWFFQYPFKRNLQRKHTIVWTSKTKILFGIAITLQILASILASASQFGSLVLIPVFFLLYGLFSPFFLIFGNVLLSPLEKYSKNKIIKAAKRKRTRLRDLKVVAIVGSFAKTSTKNMLYTLLWKDFYTVKTPKSYNTELSIARSFLADVKDTTEIFIVEMDAYFPGENLRLAKIVKPNLGVVTAIGAQHLERFHSMEALARAQFEWVSELPKDGVLFVNADDEWSVKLHPDYDGMKQVFFGMTEGRDVQVSSFKNTPQGCEFVLRIKNRELKIALPLQGAHNASNFAAAAAIAYQLGLSEEKIQERAGLLLPTDHRMEVRKMGHLTVIDNTYNTNPTTARASLKLLQDMPGSQKIVVTPGLVELGDQSDQENRLFAQEIAKVADLVIVVGEYAREPLKAGLTEAGYTPEKSHFIKDTQSALQFLTNNAQKDAIVLMENDLPDQYF